jgi:hypothetical protein
MVVLGTDGPAWALVIAQQGPEIAVDVMRQVRGVRLLTVTADVEHDRIVAAGEASHFDRYSAAWDVTEALTDLWSVFCDETVGLRVVVSSLQVDVPGVYFAEAVCTRRRWATLSQSMLVHHSVHEPGLAGTPRDLGTYHTP